MLDSCLSRTLDLSIKPRDKRIIQDGNPSQNSAIIQKIVASLTGELKPISLRGWDLNPTENLFHLTGRPLKKPKRKMLQRRHLRNFQQESET